MTEIVSANELKMLIEKVERLEKEKQEINEDLKEIFKDAKNDGFNVKIIKKIIKLRNMPEDKLEEEDYDLQILEVYKNALGM